MNDNSLAVIDQYTPVIEAVLGSVKSPATKRKYSANLTAFLDWYEAQGRPALNKAVVLGYMETLKKSGTGSQSPRLSAIKKLVSELEDNGAIDPVLAQGIRNIPNKLYVHEGKPSGNWLTREQAQKLLRLPDVKKLKGLRDRAILAAFLGTGLRRSEVARLTFAHLQEREGRPVILNIVGKRDKLRTVPMPDWCKAAINAWAGAAEINSGFIFRPVSRWDTLTKRESMTDHSIWCVVAEYAPGLAPHDLRRTFAKLARKGGAELTQIQLSLGHGDVKTTQVYVNEDQNLGVAPCDVLGISLVLR
jgi:site-specific recombinase XerD